MNKKIYAITTFFLLSASFGATAQTRYVATSGSDVSNNCDLPGSPCASVEHAVSVASASDSILVGAGAYTFDNVVNINLSGIVLTAMDPANKPEITAGDPDMISVTAPNVTISNLIFKMGLLLNGKRGIVATGNFDNITLKNNEFISTTPSGIWSPNGVVFSSYAILLNASPSTPCLATVQDNFIGPLAADYANFGRGIGLGLNSGSSASPHGNFSNNEIYAYYPVQAIFCKGNMTFENNDFSGIAMFNAPVTGANVLLNNNTFSAVDENISNYLYALIDIRAFGNGNITVSNNEFLNYSNIGLLSMASRNVEVLNNTFTPSALASEFVSVAVNTKLMTAGVQNNTYSDGITVKGNTFNAGAPNAGSALMFSDHYGANTPAFDVTVVGGPTPDEKNTFSTLLQRYIVLDSSQGSSNNIPLWTVPAVTPETIMQPVTQNVDAWVLHNNYGLYTVAEIEGKNIDSVDTELLGKVVLGDVSSVAITELSESSIKVYPNPSHGALHVSGLNDEEDIEIRIVDLTGRIMFSQFITGMTVNGFVSTDCAKLPAGNYILILDTKAGTFAEHFVKL